MAEANNGNELFRLVTRRNENGETSDVAYVKVTATCGEESSMRRVECTFDSNTGRITNLPTSSSWTQVKASDDVPRFKEKLLRRFHIEVGHAAEARIVVAQRAGKTNRYRPAGGEMKLGNDLVSHYLPPCDLSFFTRSREEQHTFDVGPIAVWTDPMNVKTGGTNRVDMWSVDKDGGISLICVYLITLDDGKTWSVVEQERWTGQVYRRKPGTTHILRSDDRRVREDFGNPAVKQMLDTYVFVPGEHSENFEKRMNILSNSKFRDLLGSADITDTWSGDDNFWFKRDPGTELRENQGIVDFMSYGVGRTSYGIISLVKPIKVGKEMRSALQFDHRAIVGDLADEQGIVYLAPGTIVDIEGFVDMDKGGKEFPPKVMKVIPRTVPVPIEPAASAAA